ncbi:D-2-hydroxyacid dehydrogenase family protein [Poseidonocella sp. HB161398]|uniref:D-2-hydroxyacid dehydrogenase family protein n=1 Tax=Poseidonocella sp. HB161398 TaxID=2320855 RepID=UPI001109F56C|nr:D-2-hydroxyacid dehydrogenase family protein [Poseidonocella sp. HB161398]
MKISILDDYQNVALAMADWDRLRGRCEIEVWTDHQPDPEILADRLKDTGILCPMRERTAITRDLMQRLPKLKMIASNSAANAAIDMEAAAELGIAVSHTDYLLYGTTELTWGLILAAIRRLPQEMASFRAGGWQGHVGQDIHGRRLGIVGLGNFGKAVARVGQAFGMEVAAWSANLDPAHAAEHGVAAVPKEELFATSDIISVHMKLSPRSWGMIGAAELGLMKPSAWIVNASRGPLIDEAALVAALRAGQIAGAALDTFDAEPLAADHPFRTLPNVVATPHIGFVTEDTYRLFYGQMAESIAAWLDGVPIRTVLPAPAA